MLFCAEKGQRLPTGEEQQALPVSESAIWANFGEPTFEDTTGKTRCVKEQDYNKLTKAQKNDLSKIVENCKIKLARTTETKEEVSSDANKSFKDKLIDTTKNIGGAVAKVTTLTAGVAIAAIPGGAGVGMGGNMIDGALGITSSGSTSLGALNKENCEEAENQLSKINNTQPQKLSVK